MFDLTQKIVADPDQLKEGVALLRRIAEALERLSPVIPSEPAYSGRQATASDVRRVDSTQLNYVNSVKQAFADLTKTVVDSDAFWQAMYEAEETVSREYGEEYVDQLEWNKGGRLFNREIYHKRKVEQERRQRDEAAKKASVQQADGGEKDTAKSDTSGSSTYTGI